MPSKTFKYGYIIPIHKKDKLIERAIKSLDGFENTLIYICCTEAVQKWIEKEVEIPEGINYVYLEAADNETSYQQLVNLGLDNVGDNMEYISILEFDDKVSPNAHEAIEPYFENDSETDIFMPLAAMVTGEDNKLQMIAMLNEAPFASNVFEDYGKFDIATMLKSNFAFVNGAYFRKSALENYGRFKNNIEMFEDYEYILRALNEGCQITSIPKIARFHFYNETGEFQRRKDLPQEERDKWLLTVRQEYFFDEDREIS